MKIKINGTVVDSENIDQKQLPLFVLMKLQEMSEFMHNEKKVNRKIMTGMGILALAIVSLHGAEVLNLIAKIF